MTNEPHSAAIDPADVALAHVKSQKRKRRIGLVSALCLGLLVGYILSPGPLDSLQRRGMLPRPLEVVLEVAYFPLQWAYNTFPTVKYFYDSYFDWME